MASVGEPQIRAWLAELRSVYAARRQWLTDLDSAIGDADHGISMDRGFAAVETALAADVPGGLGAVLQVTARVLIRSVGGASGPLYGTFFLRAATACAGKNGLEAADVVALFRAGADGVRERGKAVPGDKTMIDALLPAVTSMQERLAAGAPLADILEAGKSAAHDGMLATIPLVARKGRASYLGPRSAGHQDPGATSAYLLMEAAAKTLA